MISHYKINKYCHLQSTTLHTFLCTVHFYPFFSHGFSSLCLKPGAHHYDYLQLHMTRRVVGHGRCSVNSPTTTTSSCQESLDQFDIHSWMRLVITVLVWTLLQHDSTSCGSSANQSRIYRYMTCTIMWSLWKIVEGTQRWRHSRWFWKRSLGGKIIIVAKLPTFRR